MTMETTAELPLFSFAREQKRIQELSKTGPYSTKNSERLKILFEALEHDHSLDHACIVANISRRTVYNWIRTNPTFSKQVDQCRGEMIWPKDQGDTFNHHQYSDVLKLLQSGFSIRQALRRLLIPRRTFYRHMDSDEQLRALVNELAPKNKPGRLNAQPKLTAGPHDPAFQAQVSELLNRLKQGHTFRRACKHAGLCDSIVYKWKREHKDFANKINAVHQFDSSGSRKVDVDEAMHPNRLDVGLKGYYHLYIIKAKGCDLVKVGSSKVPSRRLIALQTGSPLKLHIDRYIVGAAIFEKDIHLDLTTRGLHSHGEWFHESCIPFVMDYIQRHASSMAS